MEYRLRLIAPRTEQIMTARNVRGSMIDGVQAGLLLNEGIFINANNTLRTDLPLGIERMIK
jgi:hypothetical protein